MLTDTREATESVIATTASLRSEVVTTACMSKINISLNTTILIGDKD
jgi:hypothetical protein